MKIAILAAVYFLTTSAFANTPMYGLFMVVKGDIKVKNLKNETAAVKVGSKIMPGETVMSGADSRAKIVMSDRNVFNVSPSTQFQITGYENDAKTGNKNVELNLIDGKVRSNVEQKYDGDKSKFQIKTPTAVAGVRGTQFVVSFDSASKISQVVTLRGAVSFASISPTGQIGTPVVVNKGESTSLNSGSTNPEPPKVMPKEELKQIDSESKHDSSDSKSADKGPQGNEGKNPPKTMVDKEDLGTTVSNSTTIDAPTAKPPPAMPPTVNMPKAPAVAIPPALPTSVPITSPDTKVIITPVPK